MPENRAKIEQFNIPEEVSRVTKALKDAGFEAYLVGGCVRDLLRGKKPKDWDVTTNATPEQITPLFPKTFYENTFGTVSIVNEELDNDDSLKVIEITPYRIESHYSDSRHPDIVSFSEKLEDDLKRRDFTINAIAYDHENSEIVDLFGGIQDLSKGIIKTVGEPDERFKEDALRILRAVRFHVELQFPLDPATEKSILQNKDNLANVSRERVRDEFIKIIMSPRPMEGLLLCRKLGLIHYIIPELEQSFDIEQNQAHSYDVWNHLLRTLQHSADKEYPLEIRLSALLHDISKPESRRWDAEKKQWTFYGHEVIGSRVTKKILENLKFSRETIDKVSIMVRWHMFFSDTETVTKSSIRRLIANVGKENIWDLVKVRLCDRIGTGRPKENPYRLRKYQSMIEEVLTDPTSLNMLKINGEGVMQITGLKSGRKIGDILYALFEEVLENPELNTEEYLKNKIVELNNLSDKELVELAKKGREMKDEKENEQIKDIKSKYKVD